jgi:hypothetical protein
MLSGRDQDLSGINRLVENRNRNPRQANKLVSQQNPPKAVIP